ncbi:MAG: hypothetical protein V3V92_03865 [Candidatus Hydrothermarchaeales archaeon]
MGLVLGLSLVIPGTSGVNLTQASQGEDVDKSIYGVAGPVATENGRRMVTDAPVQETQMPTTLPPITPMPVEETNNSLKTILAIVVLVAIIISLRKLIK